MQRDRRAAGQNFSRETGDARSLGPKPQGRRGRLSQPFGLGRRFLLALLAHPGLPSVREMRTVC